MKKGSVLLILMILLFSCNKTADSGGETLQIIVSGNNRAAMEPCGCRIPAGGLARKAGYLVSMERGQIPVLKFEGGNWLFPAFKAPGTAPAEWKGAAALQAEAYQDLDYDVINLGMTDLSMGYNYLDSLQKIHDLPFLSSNLLTKDKKLRYTPYKIFKKNSIRIAVLGVTSLSGEQAAHFAVLPPEEALRKQLPKIRNHADLILVLADMPLDKMESLGGNIPDIDFIVNTRHKARTQLPRKTHGKAVYTYLGPEGQYLGVLHLFKRSEEERFVEMSPTIHRLRFSTERLAEYKKRAGDTDIETYYQDSPGLLRTIRRYESEIERQETILDTTVNYYYWSMKILDGDVYTSEKWENAVNLLLMEN